MHHRTRLVTAVCFLVLLLIVGPSLWAVRIETSEMSRQEGSNVGDDYLNLGGSLSFSGAVESLYFFGELLTFSGETRGILLAAAENIDVGGRVGDDAFLAARTINVSGELGSTSFSASENFTLAGNARIRGALFAAARTARIDGVVEGNLYVAARRVFISGTVEGDVHARGEEIIIDPSAEIRGNFSYGASAELSDAERSRIRGTVTMVEPTVENEWKGSERLITFKRWLVTPLLLLSNLVFALLFYLFPGFRGIAMRRDPGHFWTTVGWGVIPFFGYPIFLGAVFLAGIFFGLTIPIGVALVGSLGLLAYVLTTFALPQIGQYVATIFGRNLARREDSKAIFLRTLLGFVPVLILGVIPFIKGLLFILILSLGWGVALEMLFKRPLAGE